MPKTYKPLPTAEELWQLFDYKPISGDLIWRTDISRKVRAGTKAGCLNKQRGYMVVGINRLSYPVHRLIWVWMTNTVIENMQIDHIDCDKQNNAWSNLRLATVSQNQANRGLTKANKSGLKGVGLRANGTYTATIYYRKVRYNLGTFCTSQEASAAYKNAALDIHGEFSRIC